MKAQEQISKAKPTTDQDLSLNQYSLEVLEALLKILKAQHSEASVDQQRQ